MWIRRVLPAIVLAAATAGACSGPSAPPTASQAVPSGGAAASPAGAGTSVAAPRPGFATPEDAVAAYVAAVAKADAAGVLATCAVDEKADGFDFGASVDRLRAMLLTQSLAPGTSPFFRDINRAQEASQDLARVRNLAYSLLSTEQLDGRPIIADRARAEAFAAQVDPKGLAGLAVVEVKFPRASFANDTRQKANAAAVAAIYGADESTDRVALVGLGGRTFEIGFTLLRYGSAWKVSEQVSALGGTSSLGTAVAISQADFDAQVAK